ncbi:hypothetical protein OKW43_007712 [Paraburkholderia sp. WC7.3g]|uniref:Lipoprotein n=1 Tax=Paraburkholderia podalyriae TaxID=1938811 RepID=A0ABR7Q278_9BURK|nr:hypothetical protein [Paraburkholderia podalyriae]MBC8752657.1 hypothetical protein [Paraburkholderia podalyriae]
MSILCRVQIAVTISGVVTGCVSQPIGPAVAVKPGRDKPFTVFLRDDAQCKQYAREQLARGVDPRAQSDANVSRAQLNAQQRYYLAYLECMRAKGNDVPDGAAPTTQSE